MIRKLGIIDHSKVLLVTLVVGILWFDFAYPFLEPTIQANPQIAFFFWSIIYTTIAWYAASGLVSLSRSVLLHPRYWLIIYVIGFSYDLVYFPYLVGMNGIISGLPAGARVSSDVFIYSLLPSILPEFVKYQIVYPIGFAISITLVSILAGTQKVFSNVVKAGLS